MAEFRKWLCAHSWLNPSRCARHSLAHSLLKPRGARFQHALDDQRLRLKPDHTPVGTAPRALRPSTHSMIAYKAVNNTELHITHYKIRNICKVSVLFYALYAKCSYCLLLDMQSPQVLHLALLPCHRNRCDLGSTLLMYYSTLQNIIIQLFNVQITRNFVFSGIFWQIACMTAKSREHALSAVQHYLGCDRVFEIEFYSKLMGAFECNVRSTLYAGPGVLIVTIRTLYASVLIV